MLAVTGGGDPYLVIAAISMACTVILAAAALYPQFKDRRAKEARQRQHAERLAAAADAVLGAPADPSIGRPETVGLVHVVARIERAVGTVNGSGRTVMEVVHETKRSVENMGLGQQALADAVNDHIEADDRRFADIARRLPT